MRSTTPGPEASDDPLERRLERLAWWLDSSLRVPGTGLRVGYDALVGLIPGVGDVAGAAVSAWLVNEARRLGIPRRTLLRMVGNVGLELAVGAVPVLGDLFDAWFKANQRNVRLLREARARQAASR